MAAFSSKEPLLFAAAIEALTGAGDEGVEKDLGWKSSPLDKGKKGKSER